MESVDNPDNTTNSNISYKGDTALVKVSLSYCRLSSTNSCSNFRIPNSEMNSKYLFDISEAIGEAVANFTAIINFVFTIAFQNTEMSSDYKMRGRFTLFGQIPYTDTQN